MSGLGHGLRERVARRPLPRARFGPIRPNLTHRKPLILKGLFLIGSYLARFLLKNGFFSEFGVGTPSRNRLIFHSSH